MIVPQEIYHPLYEDKEKFIILITGGRGSGKSFNASTFIERLTFEMTPVEKIVHQILYTRYTMVSAGMSIIPEMMEKIDLDGTTKYFIKYLHLSRNVIFQSTSDEETDGIKKYFSNNRIVFLNNVPTLTKIRKDYSIKKTGEAKFVFVSRIVWKKNLLFALQVINRVNDGSLQFDIYGSIEEPQYWEECLKIINNFSNKIKINYCGVCKHDDIPIILSSYDALFFPTFSENYGHIIAESLSVGLPIIISDQTPWSNINSTKGGWAIPLKDEDMYLKAVESIIGCSSTEMKYRVEDSIAFFRKFTNIDLLRDDYLKSFSSLK